MTQVSDAPSTRVEGEGEHERRRLGGIVQAMEVDLRALVMVVALAVILIGFGIKTNGQFLQPVNMVNLAVQSVSIAILATGMVLIIVSRNIDLSVGSVVGVISMVYAQLMHTWLPGWGMGFDHPLLWIVALAVGVALGVAIGGLQGFIIAYIGVPSFIVTLGGLLAFRGATWAVTKGVTISPVDPTFRLLGGGPEGSIGGTTSWIFAVVACVAIVALVISNRRQRQRFGFPTRAIWAEVVVAAVGCAAVIGLIGIFNAYKWPDALAQRHAEETGTVVPPGGISAGVPWPVIVLIGVTVVMSFLATRRRFGRYVYAIGGNPEATELAGINTRWTIMKTFILMGVLCAVSAAVATARLDGATLDLGEGYELYVIAAAVIGGTSFSGGIGTITGAVLGALVMASLSYGLSFIGLSSPIQDIVAGIVLIVAVGFDSYNRRRRA